MSIDDIDGESLAQTIVQISRDQQIIIQSVDDLKKAFPGNDIEGHRRYHESVIAMNEEKRKMYANIKEKTLGGLIWLVILSFGSFMWHWLRNLLVSVPHG